MQALLEITPADVTSVDQVILYIVGCLAITVIGLAAKIVYDMWNDKRHNREVQSKLDIIMKDNIAMKHYIKDKGVDDFIFDCEMWNKRGYITPEAHSGLLRRYNDLKDLEANGERETGKKILDTLTIRSKE